MKNILKANARETARTINQNAVSLRYDNTKARPALIGGKAKIGDPDIDALQQNIIDSNVHSALNQIENSFIPVNGIMITAENYDPAGNGMTERLTIQLPSSSVINKGTLLIRGALVEFDVGDVLTTVTQKIQDKLALLVEDQTGIDKVYRPTGTTDVLDVTYIDRNYHEPIEINDQVLGINITGSVVTHPQTGYGTWDKVAVNNTLVPGLNLSIWRRIS